MATFSFGICIALHGLPLHIGVIRQDGTQGFYRVTVSEE